MKNTNPKVDLFLSKAKSWRAELQALRTIVLGCGLTEELKWRQPCYTFQNGNVVILGEFKDYCALSFFKGVLLKDPSGLLVAPGKNTQSGRLIKFRSVQEIAGMDSILKAYIQEAIEVEKAGLKVEFKKEPEPVPDELQNKLDRDAAFKKAFNALTPGRQRAYILHFSAPKQSNTRVSRIEKCIPRILDGKGLNDCTCGLSKKFPACDGSHKSIQ